MESLDPGRLSDPVLVPCSERSAGCSQVDTRKRIVPGPKKALENSRMFRIHRQNRRMVLLGESHDDTASGHQRLLVCQCYNLPCLDRRHRRSETAEADKRSKDYVNVSGRRQRTDRIHARKDIDIMRLECVRHLLIFLFIADYDRGRTKLKCLLDKPLRTIVGREQIHLELVRMLPYHVQCLTSYGTCRSKNCDMSQSHQNFMYLVGSTASPLYQSSK